MSPPRRTPPALVACRCHPPSPSPCRSIVHRLLASRCRLPVPCAATSPPTSSLRPPPPPVLFSCSLRCPLPALATANRHCRPTAPILALLCPPPALLLVVARLPPAPIIFIGAHKGRGGDATGMLLVPKIRLTKACSTMMACHLRPCGGGRRCWPLSSPLAPTSFLSLLMRQLLSPSTLPPSSARRLQRLVCRLQLLAPHDLSSSSSTCSICCHRARSHHSHAAPFSSAFPSHSLVPAPLVHWRIHLSLCCDLLLWWHLSSARLSPL